MNAAETFDTVMELFTNVFNGEDPEDQALRIFSSHESTVNALGIMAALVNALIDALCEMTNTPPPALWEMFALRVAATRATLDESLGD